MSNSQIPLLPSDSHDQTSPVGADYSDEDLRFARNVRLAKGMLEAGVSEDQVSRILFSYPPDLIEAQLEWLPHRKAKKKASMLVASIERNYEPPAALYEQAD